MIIEATWAAFDDSHVTSGFTEADFDNTWVSFFLSVFGVFFCSFLDEEIYFLLHLIFFKR